MGRSLIPLNGSDLFYAYHGGPPNSVNHDGRINNGVFDGAVTQIVGFGDNTVAVPRIIDGPPYTNRFRVKIATAFTHSKPEPVSFGGKLVFKHNYCGLHEIPHIPSLLIRRQQKYFLNA